jgi:formylglycine-generating enzyme required for sulfatase activity
MGRVAIVGVEGSGKTVLMGALCECYKQGAADEPYLMPENQAAFMFMERIPHLLRVERKWPEATSVSGLKSMRWTLRLGAEVLEEIEMLDYPGELYRLAFGERTKEEADTHRTELNEFLEHLTSADALLVLLNLGDVQNLGANPRNAETVWITRGIFDFANQLQNLKHKALVFTQADRFTDALSSAGGPAGVYAKRLPMLKTLHPNLRIIAASAVNGVDDEGRPREGCAVDGCLVVMREIMKDLDDDFQRQRAACEEEYTSFEAVGPWNPNTFGSQVSAYAAAVSRLEQTAKTLKYGCAPVEPHKRRLTRMEELSCGLARVKGKSSREQLALATTWEPLLQELCDFRNIVTAFHEYYRVQFEQARIEREEQERIRSERVEREKQEANELYENEARAEEQRPRRRESTGLLTWAFCACLLAVVLAIGSCNMGNSQLKGIIETSRSTDSSGYAPRPSCGNAWKSPSTNMEFVWVKALGLWVGKYEVTNGEYRKMNPSHDSKHYDGHALNMERQPVVYVNFDDARTCADWLTERDGDWLGGMRYRVISEAEWQTCAQGGDGREYPWGDAMPPTRGNYADSTMTSATRIEDYTDGEAVACIVEKSGCNEWGLYGLGGNVWECCSSDTSAITFGAWRGASWFSSAPGNMRCAFRLNIDGSYRELSCGFRLVLSR